MRTIEHWIDGKPQAGTSEQAGPVFNPATGQQQAEVCFASSGGCGDRRPGRFGRLPAVVGFVAHARAKILFAFRELVNTRTRRARGRSRRTSTGR